MKDKDYEGVDNRVQQPKLLDQFLNDLIQDTQTPTPVWLDNGTAQVTREVVLSEKQASNTGPTWQAQSRIWEQVLDSSSRVPSTKSAGWPTNITIWHNLATLRLQIATVVTVVFVSLLVLLNTNLQNSSDNLSGLNSVSAVTDNIVVPDTLPTPRATLKQVHSAQTAFVQKEETVVVSEPVSDDWLNFALRHLY